MNKIIYILISQLIFVSLLNSKEPTLAFLESVHSNEVQKFSIGSYSFYCTPYGVLSLEKLMSRSKKDSACKKSIELFYKENPNLKYKIESVMSLQQRYHIEFKESQCVIYANGEKTISEILLENGLAVMEPNFKDEEFRFSMYRYEKKAKINKLGMWKNNIIRNCVTEIYEK